LQSGFWQDCTTTDFRHVDPEQTIALLPVAAVEQHGPHLPLSTDAVINDGIVAAVLERLGAAPTLLVLPALSIGNSGEHLSFGGTLAVQDSTLADAWTDVGRSVARAGVRKLVIFNTHGGQKSLVDVVALAHVGAVRRAIGEGRSRRKHAPPPGQTFRLIGAAPGPVPHR
jgi:creatinine amidohydrolase